MRSFLTAGMLGVFMVQIGGCPQMLTEGTTPGAKVITSKGEFTVTLELEKAPITVGNFMQYVQADFYDGTIFQRVVPNFIIQGGGYTPDLVLKETRSSIINESDDGLSNVRGTIAMARADDPNSARAQFFINLADNTQLDSTLDQPGYAVFGHVSSGMDVVDQIGAVVTADQVGFTNLPVEPVVITDIQLVAVPNGKTQYTPQGEQMVQQQQYQALLWLRSSAVSLLQFALTPR